MMTDYTDETINELVFKAIVPKGLRPETPEEIDAMLDALGGEMQSEDDVQRMLRKIRGEEPLGDPTAERDLDCHGDATAELSDAELALYRNRNEDVPPEVDQMLQDMEDEALKDGEEDEDDSDDNDA
jgi:hypothetical protein